MNRKQLTAAIDAAYYTDVYKPHKNAMITGSFNNVAEHIANFDPFRNRATEIIDTLTQNKISNIGGVEYLIGYEQSVVKKAVAGLVEFWNLRGFNLADLDSALSLGNLNVRQLIKSEKFRNVIPLNVISLLKKSSMWKGKVISIGVEKAIDDIGLDATELLTISEALALFEMKGYATNYNKDLDMTAELTNLPNITRFIKVAETSAQNVSFKITGGDNTITKTEIEIQHDGTAVSLSEAIVFTKRALQAGDNPRYFYKLDSATGVISIYVAVNDDIKDKHLLLSEIYADDTGEYGLLGSRTNSNDLTEIMRASIFGNQVSITGAATEDFVKQQDALLEGRIKTNIDANTRLAKKAEADAGVAIQRLDVAQPQISLLNGEITDNNKLITTNGNEIKKSKDKIAVLESDAATTGQTIGVIQGEVANAKQDINTIKSAGVHIPHFNSEAERDRAITSPVEGQVAYTGTNGAWILNTYENGVWVKGQVSQHNTAAKDASKADIDLSNVNVGTANSGKLLQVKADGTLEYVAKPKEYEIKEHFWKGTRDTTPTTIITIPQDEEKISINIYAVYGGADYVAEVLQTSPNTWEVGYRDQGRFTFTYNNNKLTKSGQSGGDNFNISVNITTRKEV